MGFVVSELACWQSDSDVRNRGILGAVITYFCTADLDGNLDRERALELLDAFCELGPFWRALGIVELQIIVSVRSIAMRFSYHFLILKLGRVP
jgi:hypothetical protein